MDAVVISNNQFLSTKAAAFELGMSKDFILDLIYAKKIDAYKVGAHWRIDLDSWRRYIASLRKAA